MREPSPYDGLLALTLRRVTATARAAGVLWVIVVAVLALPWVEPWLDDGWEGVRRWALAVLGPAAAVVVLSFAYHYGREAFGRYRVRPTAVYNEGKWWLTIDPRGLDGSVGVRCKVKDEDGAAATHEFAQEANGRIIDWFPDEFDVTGMTAGRKQPWGRYEATWQVVKRGHRTRRATVAFEWHILTPSR